MRAALLLLLAPLAVSAAETRLTDPTSRYSAMLEQSPFALATVVEAPPEPTESFTANWELTGIAKLKNEQGEERDFITIRSRDRRLSFTLYGDQVSTEEEAKGVSIHSVDRQEGPRKSSVMLKRGADLGKVEFSQESSAPPVAQQMQVNTAGMNPAQAQQARQVQVQQMQAAQAAQAARMQQMQSSLTFGGSTKLGAVFNSVQAGQRPPTPGVGQPIINGNGLNTAMPVNPNGIVYPAPNAGDANNVAPNSADPRRRLRVINTR